jgi:predicted RNase H-like HicB family nuclease
MTLHIGIIHKDPRSDYSVSFPDFPGCVTAGSTLDEARALAEEALAFHVEGMLADGDALPEPASLERVMSEAHNRRGVAILVPVKGQAPKAVRINITLPEDVLGEIDRFAEARGLTRSGFLARAARRAIDQDAA